MTTISGLDRFSGASLPTLDAFREAASKGEDVFITVDGEQLRVLGEGRLPGSGRAVAWVEGGDGTSNTQRVFGDALAGRYGSGVAGAVMRELGIDTAAAGKPIAARTVRAALDMAATAGSAIEGANFAVRFAHSAAIGSPAFRDAVIAAGKVPDEVDASTRARIDAAFDARWQAAQAAAPGPLSMEQAAAWLREAVRSELG